MSKRGSRINVKTETPSPKSRALMECSHRNFRRDAEKALRVKPQKQQIKPEGFA